MFAKVDEKIEQYPDLPIDYAAANWRERKTARKLYIVQQHGRCYYCKGPLGMYPAQHVLDKKVDKDLFPVGFFDNPIHLHHNHDSNMTIGVVHAYCNAVLWEYEGE